jgi:hypothetical protein
MTLRVVAIPLIAAICLGSPATASTSTDEQQVNGRGARDRQRTAVPRGGDRGGDQNRGGDQAPGGDRNRDNDRRDNGGQRDNGRGTARDNGRRDNDRRDNRPVVITRNRPNVNINIGSPFRGPRYYAPAYYDRWARQYYRWSPIGYAPWGLIAGSIGYSNFGLYGGVGPNPFYGTYGYGYGGNYGYGSSSPWQPTGYDIGGIRLKIRPRDAQVFVDGYYAGLVDDFDGTFQSLRLEQGGHKLEIHMPGFEDLELDVHVQPGRTITLSEQLRPRP